MYESSGHGHVQKVASMRNGLFEQTSTCSLITFDLPCEILLRRRTDWYCSQWTSITFFVRKNTIVLSGMDADWEKIPAKISNLFFINRIWYLNICSDLSVRRSSIVDQNQNMD